MSKQTKTLVELLAEVQSELKAPKGQRNNFGKYNYRSAEDIVESVKPLLNKRNLVLNVSDEMTLLGDRYYIKATASVIDSEHDRIEAVGYAREADTQSGMSAGQITGATSSYARKYALNGLFAIDDTKDLDSEEYQGKSTKSAPVSAPKGPFKSTNDLPWLNKGSDDYAKVEKAIKDKKATIEDVLKKFKLSSVVRKELENLV